MIWNFIAPTTRIMQALLQKMALCFLYGMSFEVSPFIFALF